MTQDIRHGFERRPLLKHDGGSGMTKQLSTAAWRKRHASPGAGVPDEAADGGRSTEGLNGRMQPDEDMTTGGDGPRCGEIGYQGIAHVL